MQKIQRVGRHVRTEGLRPFSVTQEKHMQETDLNEMVIEVQNLLPLFLHSNPDSEVTVTLSKKSLTIMADSALMMDALLRLVRHARDAMLDGGMCSLSVKQVDLKKQPILDGDNGPYGACASIAVADTGRGFDEKTRKKTVQPPCATRTLNRKDADLSTAYRIIKQHHGSMKVESVAGQSTTIMVYLPLARLDDTSQNTRSTAEVV